MSGYTLYFPKTELINWLYALLVLFILSGTAARRAMARLLMKLYEFFIQRFPVSI